MGTTGTLPRSGQGDPSDYVNLENARLQNVEIDGLAQLIGDGQKRTLIFLQLQDTEVGAVYIGFDNTVAASGANRGIKIPVGREISFNFAETIPLWAISSGTPILTVVEAF